MASSPLSDKKRFLAGLVPLLEQGGCQGSALYLKDSTLTISKDKTSIDVAREQDEGVKLRVYDGFTYHERGVSGWDEKELRAAAAALGKAKARPGGVPIEEGEQIDAEYKALGKTDPATVGVKEKIAMANTLHERMSSLGAFVNVRFYYDEMRESKIFVSAKRKLSQEISGCLVILMPFVRTAEGETRYHYLSFFDHGYERTRVPLKELKEGARFAERIASAKRLPPGKYACILSPNLSGLLAHESFGHGMEADTVYKGRAKAREWLGKRLAPEYVSVADGPLVPGKHGFYFFDDEGWPATKTLMIDKGIVGSPLTDAYHAARLKVPRSSNARAESFDRKIYARMTNTYFEPGAASKDEMIAQVRDGLYLHNASGGMEDPKGWGIQIQGITAERIRDGKLTGELYYEAGMTGYLPDVLGNIQAVSKEWEIPGTGRCGKGHHDWVRVSEGGPYLLIRDVVLS